MLKAAPKQTRLDAAPLRKRAAARGGSVQEVKPGDAVIGLTEAWEVARFVEPRALEAKATGKPKKTSGKKKVAKSPKKTAPKKPTTKRKK
jgi:hypothetical protein